MRSRCFGAPRRHGCLWVQCKDLTPAEIKIIEESTKYRYAQLASRRTVHRRAGNPPMLDGDTVATTARQGRQTARAKGDPTWLAYSV